MKLPRRNFLHLAAGAAALPVLSRAASALDYPMRPVRMVVGFAPGTGPDIIVRLLAQRLSARLGQQVVIDNRPGAGTNIATEVVVHASPDGYTLLVITGVNTVNATLYHNLNFDFIHEIAPVAGLASGQFVMVVTPSFPAKSVPEFIAYAKANPGKINMASVGVGAAGHVFGELFKMMAGVDLLHVPYRNNFYPDLLSGQMQVAFANVASSIEFIRAGKLRALAVTTAERSDLLPDLPTINEFVPDYEASGWYGIGAPWHTHDDIVRKLNTEINAVLADPTFRAKLAEFGNSPLVMTPSQLEKFMADDIDKWAKVIKFANIKPE